MLTAVKSFICMGTIRKCDLGILFLRRIQNIYMESSNQSSVLSSIIEHINPGNELSSRNRCIRIHGAYLILEIGISCQSENTRENQACFGMCQRRWRRKISIISAHKSEAAHLVDRRRERWIERVFITESTGTIDSLRDAISIIEELDRRDEHFRRFLTRDRITRTEKLSRYRRESIIICECIWISRIVWRRGWGWRTEIGSPCTVCPPKHTGAIRTVSNLWWADRWHLYTSSIIEDRRICSVGTTGILVGLWSRTRAPSTWATSCTDWDILTGTGRTEIRSPRAVCIALHDGSISTIPSFLCTCICLTTGPVSILIATWWLTGTIREIWRSCLLEITHIHVRLRNILRAISPRTAICLTTDRGIFIRAGRRRRRRAEIRSPRAVCITRHSRSIATVSQFLRTHRRIIRSGTCSIIVAPFIAGAPTYCTGSDTIRECVSSAIIHTFIWGNTCECRRKISEKNPEE